MSGFEAMLATLRSCGETLSGRRVPHSAVLPGSRSCFSLVQDVVGAKWAQLTTPGFSVLNLNRRHLSRSQLVAISRAHDRRRAMLRPIASCCATWVTISVTDA